MGATEDPKCMMEGETRNTTDEKKRKDFPLAVNPEGAGLRRSVRSDQQQTADCADIETKMPNICKANLSNLKRDLSLLP